MKFLASKQVSGVCAVVNGVLAVSFVFNGSWLLALMSAGFCGLCTRNYLVADDQDMDIKERGSLSDEQMLFTILTALVKKADGEIRITEEEMDSVTKSDMMLMYYDKKKKEIILAMHMLSGPSEEF